MSMLNIQSNNKINFESTIRIIGPNAFISSINRIYPYEVMYPWTIKESKLCKDVYTRGIFDCTAVGVTNGKEALLMHICPTEPKNYNFTEIKDYLLAKIAKMRNEYLQGLVLGGKFNNKHSPKSIEFFDNFCEIFKQECIPFSKFKGGAWDHDLAYFSEKDTWLVSNDYVDSYKRHFKNPIAAAKYFFDDVELCSQDELSW